MGLLVFFDVDGGGYLLGAMAWLGSLDADSGRGHRSAHIETNALKGALGRRTYEAARPFDGPLSASRRSISAS
jgi:hypothetical protein